MAGASYSATTIGNRAKPYRGKPGWTYGRSHASSEFKRNRSISLRTCLAALRLITDVNVAVNGAELHGAHQHVAFCKQLRAVVLMSSTKLGGILTLGLVVVDRIRIGQDDAPTKRRQAGW